MTDHVREDDRPCLLPNADLCKYLSHQFPRFSRQKDERDPEEVWHRPSTGELRVVEEEKKWRASSGRSKIATYCYTVRVGASDSHVEFVAKMSPLATMSLALMPSPGAGLNISGSTRLPSVSETPSPSHVALTSRTPRPRQWACAFRPSPGTPLSGYSMVELQDLMVEMQDLAVDAKGLMEWLWIRQT